MKNLAVLLVFVLSLVGVIHALEAQAHNAIRVEPAMTAPVPFGDAGMDASVRTDCLDDATAIAKKKKKKKDKRDRQEEDEEEFRLSPGALRALEIVDPGALEFVVQMNSVALR